jgi:hypothetical protein
MARGVSLMELVRRELAPFATRNNKDRRIHHREPEKLDLETGNRARAKRPVSVLAI